MSNDRIADLKERLRTLDAERAAIERELLAFESTKSPSLTPAEKISLFRRLFVGRTDVYARRWENAKDGRSGYAPVCGNEWAAGVCNKPKIKCGACPNQAFTALDSVAISSHLRGTAKSGSSGQNFVLGVYPLLNDDTCWFLAADFDGAEWSDDALAFLETCDLRDIPASLERSRSGNGGHIWIFFERPMPAREARQLGSALMTETMERRPEISFDSYDRFFPNQDVMPAGGFGNLIALPLARRARNLNNSVFVDKTLTAYPDQWAYLASIRRAKSADVSRTIEEARATGRILGVRMPIDEDETEDPWLLPPSRERPPPPITAKLPPSVNIVIADGLHVDRTDLPAAVVTRLKRVASFANPEFHRAQAMRMPTYGKPRIISCAELYPRHLTLPRGCYDEALRLMRSLGIRIKIEDRRHSAPPLQFSFTGILKPPQQAALDDIVRYDDGVLCAGTGFGKTVVAAAAIARRATNTLILVHRRELLEQWIERLGTFLSVEKGDVGAIGGGRKKPTGRIDVAMIQSLVRGGIVSDLVAEYGHIIVDECHHISASSFELVLRRARPRYVLGLSATVTRKDGHHPIIFMQCGPVRHRVDPRAQAAERNFEHIVCERQTTFVLPSRTQTDQRASMPEIYAALAADEHRNRLIVDDIIGAIEEGRRPLVLTERRDHLDALLEQLQGAIRNIVVLHGGMKASTRKAALADLRSDEIEEQLVLATGRYIGEGFDHACFDTLFLALPISWKGTLAQYVGRLHREFDGKRDVVVYDYIDDQVPLLARMGAKRRNGYRAMGYRQRAVSSTGSSKENILVTRVPSASSKELPSSVFDRYWIFAEPAAQSPENEHTERGGKWLLFIKHSEVDEWWTKIKAATIAGRLGSGAKASTMKPNPLARDPNTKVICVYTYDADDTHDCTRVRNELRALGVTWKIPYKPDALTNAGRYSTGGADRISARYE